MSPGLSSARRLAQERRTAIRRRTHHIRRWVAALAVALFLCAFAVVYVQMASGHDPALTASSHRNATTTGSAARSEATSTSSEASSSAEEEEFGEEGSSEAGPSAVTTSQS